MSEQSEPKQSEDQEQPKPDEAETPKLDPPHPETEGQPWARITVRQREGGRVQIDREYFPKGQASPDHVAHAVVYDLCQYLEKTLQKDTGDVAQEQIKDYTGPRGLEEMRGPSDLTH